MAEKMQRRGRTEAEKRRSRSRVDVEQQQVRSRSHAEKRQSRGNEGEAEKQMQSHAVSSMEWEDRPLFILVREPETRATRTGFHFLRVEGSSREADANGVTDLRKERRQKRV